MSDAIKAVALANGVRPSVLRAALEDGDARLVADLLGVDRAELAEQLAALARVGVAPERVAAVAVLGA